MLNLVKTISTELDNLNRRIVKFLRFGKSDVQTSLQASPPGVDANPIKNMVAVYASTEEKGKTVIVGYINKNQVAKPGEHKIFSMNDEGDEETYIYLKDDGTMEIGGASDFMVRYNELETAFNELQDSVNEMVDEWNAFATAYVPGSPTVTGLPPTANTVSNASADITPSKIEEIKTL